ncbi:MAG: VWA-like domain-containing protein, partial [Chloroflexota bacterium]
QPLDERSRTFGVVLDTPGSMSRALLAKALGSIASYALARNVPRVRVVFCDAHAYDQGYMPVEQIVGKVKVRGRGGTILMPGIRLLENAEDFPDAGPILIITDTYCDRIQVKASREHAYLVPKGGRLPFPTDAPVFYVE